MGATSAARAAGVYAPTGFEGAKKPPCRNPIHLIFEGSGLIQIPVDWDGLYWPEQRIERKPFELTEAKLLFISRRLDEPWIDRAYEEAFWQCHACYRASDRQRWHPWPVEVKVRDEPVRGADGKPMMDDSAWEFFIQLEWETRERLRRQSIALIRYWREIRTAAREKGMEQHAMRAVLKPKHHARAIGCNS